MGFGTMPSHCLRPRRSSRSGSAAIGLGRVSDVTNASNGTEVEWNLHRHAIFLRSAVFPVSRKLGLDFVPRTGVVGAGGCHGRCSNLD